MLRPLFFKFFCIQVKVLVLVLYYWLPPQQINARILCFDFFSHFFLDNFGPTDYHLPNLEMTNDSKAFIQMYKTYGNVSHHKYYRQ